MDIHAYTTPINKSKDFTLNLCEKLLSFTKKGLYTDVCIASSDHVKFFANSCVLAASTDFFSKLIDETLMQFSAVQVEIPSVTSEVFKPILKWMYTGQIDLTTETVEGIVNAAIYLEIRSLTTECFQFMSLQIHDLNCLYFVTFSDRDGFTDLFQKGVNFCSSIFEQIAQQEEFLNLNEHQLVAIISSKSLNVSSEENVFLSLLKWMEHDKKNRTKAAHTVFSHVRYWLLKPDFIKKQRSKLPSQVKCLEMVCSWLEWHLLNNGQQISEEPLYLKLKPHVHLLLVGGGAIQSYDGELALWTREEVPGLPIRFDKVVSYKKKLIFASLDKPLLCFDLETKETTRLPKMNVPRRNCAIIVIKENLYVFGGQKKSSLRLNAEMYDFRTGEWTELAPMNATLISPKIASTFNEIYVVGDQEPTMECYNIYENKWSSEAMVDPQTSRFGFEMFGGDFYKLGGAIQHDGMKAGMETWSKSLHVFNMYKQAWRKKANMKIAVTDPICTRWNNRLLAIGGRDENGTRLNLVQEYNRDLNQWKIMPQLVEFEDTTDYGIVTIDPTMC